MDPSIRNLIVRLNKVLATEKREKHIISAALEVGPAAHHIPTSFIDGGGLASAIAPQ